MSPVDGGDAALRLRALFAAQSQLETSSIINQSAVGMGIRTSLTSLSLSGLKPTNSSVVGPPVCTGMASCSIPARSVGRCGMHMVTTCKQSEADHLFPAPARIGLRASSPLVLQTTPRWLQSSRPVGTRRDGSWMAQDGVRRHCFAEPHTRPKRNTLLRNTYLLKVRSLGLANIYLPRKRAATWSSHF